MSFREIGSREALRGVYSLMLTWMRRYGGQVGTTMFYDGVC
jgi:hypothetical protein